MRLVKKGMLPLLILGGMTLGLLSLLSSSAEAAAQKGSRKKSGCPKAIASAADPRRGRFRDHANQELGHASVTRAGSSDSDGSDSYRTDMVSLADGKFFR